MGAPVNWYRAHHGRPTDPTWRLVAKRANSRPSDVWAVYSAVYDYASQHDDRGSIAGFDFEVLADFLDLGADELGAIVASLRDRGILAGERIASWEREQPVKEDLTVNERSRRFRAKQRTAPPARAAATTGNAAATPGNDREEQIREDQRESPPLPPQGATHRNAARLSLSKSDLSEEWAEEAGQARANAKLTPVNLAAEWTKFRARSSGPPDHGRWIGWAMNARAAPGPEAEPSPEAPVSLAQQRRTAFWAGLPDAGRQPIEWRARLQGWAEKDFWLPAFGAKPGEPDCGAPAELVAYAIAKQRERWEALAKLASTPPAKRRQEKRAQPNGAGAGQGSILLPLAGGAEDASAAPIAEMPAPRKAARAGP